MSIFKRQPIAETAIGIKIDGMNDFAVREVKDTILAILNARCSDRVKVAALEVVGRKVGKPLVVSDCDVRMGQ